MAEEKQQEKHKIRNIVLVIGFSVFLILIAVFFPFGSRISIDEQIKALEAQRYIPDEENAATIYKKLFADFNENDFNSVLTGVDIYDRKFKEPWRSADDPNAAKFLKNKEQTISTLFEAFKKEKCYFPLDIEFNPYDPNSIIRRIGKFRNLALLLNFAANNDIGEGRIDDAIEKSAGMLQMAGHLYQQKQTIAMPTGFVTEQLIAANLKTLVVEGDITESQLNHIKTIPFQIKDQWNTIYPEMKKIDKLIEKKAFSKVPFIYRMTMFLNEHIFHPDIFHPVPSTIIYESYLRVITGTHGIKILIALRQYKNKNGNWPEKLELIKPFVEPEILIDPFNNSDFVYKLTDEGFKLYSRGPNKIDEGGTYIYSFEKKSGPDDWPIWPKR